jgi:3-dehydroquinate dehydratase/shikimate dehydrogenase
VILNAAAPAGPLVVCSVLPADVAQAGQMLSRAPGACGLVELRADHLRPEEISSIVRGTGIPLIVTIRHKDDGGVFEGSEQEREQGLRAALESGARFVDVEWDRPLAALVDEPALGTNVILSSHGLPCETSPLVAEYRRMRERSAGPLKIVADARSVDEVQAVRQLLREAALDGGQLAAFAMGGPGATSRLLAPCWGSWATYGALTAGSPTAAGQYTASEMLETYDVLTIGPQTRLFALVGNRVGGSPSPAMHAAGYRRHGVDARYLAVETDSFDAFASWVDPERGIGLAGFAVTLPFKEQAAAHCSPQDAVSAACGAVNTVIIEDGVMRGYNTDGAGVLGRLRTYIDPAGKRAAILGAGGTARSVAFELVRAGCEVTLFNRTAERAREGARAVGATAAPLERLSDHAWDILVNATPQGGDGRRFLDPDLLRGRVVVDAVYAPRSTALIRDARDRGLDAIDGLDMLAAQGVLQFRHMTGVDVELEVLHAAAAQRISAGTA